MSAGCCRRGEEKLNCFCSEKKRKKEKGRRREENRGEVGGVTKEKGSCCVHEREKEKREKIER